MLNNFKSCKDHIQGFKLYYFCIPICIINSWCKYSQVVLQVVPSAQMHCLMIKGTSSYRLCFKYFFQLFSILDWFRNVYIIRSCFERWWCNKTGQACNLEIILVKTGVRSVWFHDFRSLCKVNYPISMSLINFNHFKKK